MSFEDATIYDLKVLEIKINNLCEFAHQIKQKAYTRSLVYSYEIKELADRYLTEDKECGKEITF